MIAYSVNGSCMYCGPRCTEMAFVTLRMIRNTDEQDIPKALAVFRILPSSQREVTGEVDKGHGGSELPATAMELKA